MYATPVVLLKAKQNNKLNVCWNMIFHKIFGYHKRQSELLLLD